MKQKIKLLAIIAALGITPFLLNSCQEDESLERKGKPTITVDNKDITITEGEDIELDFTFEFPIKSVAELRMEVLSSSTADGDDYINELPTVEDIGGGFFGGPGYYIEIDPLTSHYTLTLESVQDIFPEGAETLELRFFSVGKGEIKIDQTVKVTINNYTSTDLISILNWNGTYIGTDGEEHDNCDIDFDLELYDESFNVVADSYTNCPEEIISLTGDLADGDYYIIGSFWSLGDADPMPDQDIPFTVTVAKQGVWARVFEYPDLINTSTVPAENGNADAYVPVGIVTKAGDTYTLSDFEGNVLEQGKIKSNMFKKGLKKTRK
ncbi:hypothetical protein [Flavobacterium pedocola]